MPRNKEDDTIWRNCPRCKATGVMVSGEPPVETPCPRCNGRKKIDWGEVDDD